MKKIKNPLALPCLAFLGWTGLVLPMTVLAEPPSVAALSEQALRDLPSFQGLSEDNATDDDALRFPIVDYRFSGNARVPDAEIAATLEAFRGPQGSFEMIQNAIAAVESRYLEHGFGAVKVVLPEQEIDQGLIELRIVEGVVGEVKVEGLQFASLENIRASVPGLREGEQPNMRDIDAALRVVNEGAVKQMALTFRQSPEAGKVDALIRVKDEDPVRYALSFDNSSSPVEGRYPTGRFRSALIVQHGNLWGRDHALSAQFMTSPDHHTDDVTILGGSYRIPLYALGDVLELSGAYSNVNSGKLGGSLGSGNELTSNGAGKVLGVKYEQFLPNKGNWTHKLVYGLDHREYINATTDASGNRPYPDVNVTPASLSYQGRMAWEGGELSLSAGFVQNIKLGGDASTEHMNAFDPNGNRNAVRVGATADYQIWRYSLSTTWLLPQDWLFKWAINGQDSGHVLIPGEQFGAGGVDSVRGFYERQLSGDTGHRTGIELYTPELAGLLGLTSSRLRLLWFYEMASVQNNTVNTGELPKSSIASTGLGVRATVDKSLSVRLDWGTVVDGYVLGSQHRGSRDNRLHANLVFSF